MSGSKTQKQHLEELTVSFAELNDMLKKHLDDKGLQAELAPAVLRLGESVHGLDLRLINDEIAHRVIQGSEIAVRAVVDKPRALSNRSAAATPEGLKVDYNDVKPFLYAVADVTGVPNIHTQFFPGTLSLITKMFEIADDNERKVLVDLAAKARVHATS